MSTLKTLEDFHAAYRTQHATNPRFCQGHSIGSYVPDISSICSGSYIKTVLDYGCGKAGFHKTHNMKDMFGWSKLHLYDPGLPEYEMKPPAGQLFDLVMCIDVLEHVPENYIDQTIEELVSHTGKVLFVAVSCRPAKKTLPDGTNAHVTVQDPYWWKAKFKNIDKYVKLRCVI